MLARLLITALLLALLAAVQAQIWLGRGSIVHVRDMQQQIAAQKAENALAGQRNMRLAFEVQDLREGLDMVEEKARSELGMVKPNEIFVQITGR